jgi:hypothetical protein
VLRIKFGHPKYHLTHAFLILLGNEKRSVFILGLLEKTAEYIRTVGLLLALRTVSAKLYGNRAEWQVQIFKNFFCLIAKQIIHLH